VLDLSQAGHQPMVSSSGRYVVAYNGEIYNHRCLREELDAKWNWRGHSDTETLLAGVEAWGLEATLRKVIGMFALALWDSAERVLYLARDRMGEKPLYYGWQGSVFLFGSELKALRQHPAFEGKVDRGALALQMRHGCVPGPHSIYKRIRKLPSATYLKLSTNSGHFNSRELPEPKPYWSLAKIASIGQENPFAGDEVEAVDTLDRLLHDSVRQQMLSDVPLGAFLSGGVDSSTVVALMQAQSDRPVKTFTIGFEEREFNEAEHAKSIAQHLGTDHTELYVSSQEAMDVISSLPTLYDEPFSDSSQIPTFLISKLVRKHVTVSLSGDAGDELFGGYNRHFVAPKLFKKFSWLPYSVRRNLVRLLGVVPARAWEAIGRFTSFSEPSEKMRKVADVLGARNMETVYRRLTSHWKSPSDIVIGAAEPLTVGTDDADLPVLSDMEHRMMYLDAMNYLPDDILVKVDRASMAVSLESRVPFLDHRIVEFAWRLPLSMKIRNGQGKWILRQMLYKYVPKALIERPKMGFGVPIGSWLRGPLRDWAESLLDEARLCQEGYFHSEPICKKWREHCSGQRNWQYYLWDVLMFQAWLEDQ